MTEAAQRVKARLANEEGLIAVGPYVGTVEAGSDRVDVWDDDQWVFAIHADLLDLGDAQKRADLIASIFDRGYDLGRHHGEVQKAAEIRRALKIA